MIDTKHTFNKFFRELLEQNCPGVKFYPKKDFKKLEYPCVTFDYGNQRKTNTLAMWMLELQINVLFDEWKEAECDLAVQHIFEALGIAADRPDVPRRIPKLKWVGENGQMLPSPVAYQDGQSDIQWRYPVDSEIDTVYEPEKPELIHKTFTIYLYYKNR